MLTKEHMSTYEPEVEPIASTAKIPSEESPGVTNTNKQVIASNGANIEAAKSNSESQKELQVGTYTKLKKSNANSGLSADHIPSFASLKRTEEARLGRSLSASEENTLKMNALSLSIKTQLHIDKSATFGGRNNEAMQIKDSQNPLQAVRDNINAYRSELIKEGYTNEEINKAIDKLSVPFNSTSSPHKK